MGSKNGQVGYAKYVGRRPLALQPGAEAHVTCAAPRWLGGQTYTVLAEGRDTGDGLVTGKSLGIVKNGRITVHICNLTTQPVKIYCNASLADLYVGVQVIDTMLCGGQQDSSTQDVTAAHSRGRTQQRQTHGTSRQPHHHRSQLPQKPVSTLEH